MERRTRTEAQFPQHGEEGVRFPHGGVGTGPCWASRNLRQSEQVTGWGTHRGRAEPTRRSEGETQPRPQPRSLRPSEHRPGGGEAWAGSFGSQRPGLPVAETVRPAASARSARSGPSLWCVQIRAPRSQLRLIRSLY